MPSRVPVSRRLPLLAFFAFFLPVLSLRAQAPPEIDKLAAQVAEKVEKTHAKRILVISLPGCLMDTQVCTISEEALHAALTKMIPDVQFVSREDVTRGLKRLGFLTIDMYDNDVLELVAPKVGAEILITERLCWVPEGYELIVYALEAAKGKKLGDFKTQIARLVPDPGEETIVIKDPETKTSLFFPKNEKYRNPTIKPPMCLKCPQPMYSNEAVRKKIEGTIVILATVTDQGVPENIIVVKSLGEDLDSRAVQAVRGWSFKAGVGLDGEPIAQRVKILVAFRLYPK